LWLVEGGGDWCGVEGVSEVVEDGLGDLDERDAVAHVAEQALPCPQPLS